jgi:hypothetical protein
VRAAAAALLTSTRGRWKPHRRRMARPAVRAAAAALPTSTRPAANVDRPLGSPRRCGSGCAAGRSGSAAAGSGRRRWVNCEK